MIEHVEFTAGDVTLAGDLRTPPGAGPHPALVFTGPFTGVKEQVTGTYAARLAEAGYVTLAFDHRNFGASGGSPRHHEDPQGKLTDLRSAVSYLRTRPEVDGDRIGVVGICLGAGYALRFAAFDPRVKVFAGIAGAYNNPYAMRSGMTPPGYEGALAAFTGELERQDQGADPEYIPAVATSGEAAMPGDEPYAYYGTARSAAPSWTNKVTRSSLRELITLDNMMGADFLSPKPALIVHGVVDRFCPPEGAEEAYKRLDPPKRLIWLDTHLHTDLYDTDPHLTHAIQETTTFLNEHL
ncbi:alpha/beta hydrolase [Sphaerisporangium aureirubrum]|uniref:Alpha/beta hydrolase n=1 Tax=Sphaerisporangium aureirubrum TaxID=1544736 RepID=A0ABW1NTC8_9ACTN